jgi:hypothetical protein
LPPTWMNIEVWRRRQLLTHINPSLSAEPTT